ncbi:unnamed protein product [Darwinula stevensoni]|uniref:Tyrosine--tRNA ligase n=1 Tax=Darwinula stevensoni TaxID=69355 RepID=A0A7R8X0Q8_9CRUS|nr:unnamed protein product [Darwinula stevensoni]CAG0881910.1 unnamed protein product [Darwinula stevensoni]
MTVRSNAIRLEKQLRRIFDNHEKYFWEKSDPLVPLKVLNNMDWYEQFGIVDFLQEVGRHLRMNAMISRQSVKTRLDGSGLSFTEFTYQAMQAYDWLHLFRKFKCRVQIGGNDQIGNIVTGHDLLSRAENTQVYGLTVPLVTAESGDKYGKSAGNALWLDPEMTLPFDLHQFFLRLPDPIAETFLRLFSFLPQSQVEQLVENHLLAPEKRIPHKYLAENVVTLVHGVEGLQSAQRATEALFQNSAEALCDMSQDELSCLLRGAPQVSLLLKPGTTILDAAMQAKCFLTERDAHRIITSGGFYVNQRKVTNPNIVLIEGEHILPNRMTVARVGKKSHVLIRWAI